MKRYGFLISYIILACIVMWSNLALAQCPPGSDCRQHIVFAKRPFSPEPSCFEKFDCAQPRDCDDCILRIQWNFNIISVDPQCDETETIVPDGSVLKVDLKYHIRRNGPCRTPVGTHEGQFKIFNPAGGLIGSGKMRGTNGLDSDFGDERCCAWPNDEGAMDGTITVPSSGRCNLIATYESEILRPGQEDVCNKEFWKNLELRIEGVLLCRCPRPRR